MYAKHPALYLLCKIQALVEFAQETIFTHRQLLLHLYAYKYQLIVFLRLLIKHNFTCCGIFQPLNPEEKIRSVGKMACLTAT